MREKVRLIDDPILRKVCTPVNLLEDSTFVVGLLDAMNETMIAENGIGLAANQIGQSVQVFILKRDNTYNEYINPTIVAASKLVDFDAEGCLSIPGTFGKTKRYSVINLEWFTKDGVKHHDAFVDMQAFAVQHEMDHLNGKLYIDQFGPMKKDLVLSKHRKFLRGY